MARNKVKVAYILNDPTRKATGKKRATGALKKAGELSVLCGVDACMVIILEDGTVLAWPSLPEAMRVIERYRSTPEVDRCKKKMDCEDYVRDRIAKLQEQLRRAELDNRRRETMLLLHDAMVGGRQDLVGLTVEQLVAIGWTTECLINKIKDCIPWCRGQQAVVNDHPPLPYDATTGPSDVDAPDVQQGWVMEVVKAGCVDLDALPYNGSSSGSGSSGSVGAGGDMIQLGNMDSGFAWADPGTYYRPV